MKLIEFKDAVEVLNNKAVYKRDYKDSGTYPIVSQEKEKINGFTDESDYIIKPSEPLIAFGDHTKVVKYIDFTFVKGADGLKVLQVNDDLNPRYFFYWLKSLSLDDLGYARHFKLLKDLQIPVPPLQEQEKIVERLDKVFEYINTNQEKILNLEFLTLQMKDSFVNKNLSKEKTQILSSFSNIQYGFTPDKNSREKIQVPIIRITDIQNNKVDWENVPNVKVSQETFDKFCLKKGDILFARTGGTLGKSYLFDEDKKAIFASYLIRVTNIKSDFNPKFLKYFFESTEYWKQVNQGTIGAAQPFFNGKKLGNLKIPNSNKDKQKLIIKKLDKLTDLIEKLNDLNMLKKNKYSNFQKSILNKEFSYE